MTPGCAGLMCRTYRPPEQLPVFLEDCFVPGFELNLARAMCMLCHWSNIPNPEDAVFMCHVCTMLSSEWNSWPIKLNFQQCLVGWSDLGFEVVELAIFLIGGISLRQMWIYFFAVRAYLFWVWMHVLLFSEEFLCSVRNHVDFRGGKWLFWAVVAF